MNTSQRVTITRLSTGVPGLDEILGGGLPEYSFNLIVGTPGTGKTTLAHQMLFALASPARRAMYFSVIGEPMLKMLRYQQQMAYFDPAKVGECIDFINLSDAVLSKDLNQVLADIVALVEEKSPGFVVLDSFQNIAQLAAGRQVGVLDVQGFVQRLALHLTSWQATTFLLGNYRDEQMRDDPVFTVADGVIWLSQVADHNSVVRKLQVVKMRGQEPMPGLHTVRLNQEGLQVFPRITIDREGASQSRPPERTVTGVPGLDALVGGGLPAGDAVLVSGPSGTGKSVLTAQFIAAGVAQGEPGVIAVFEEHPQEYMRRARLLGLDLEQMVRQGSLEVIYIRPLDLSPDETLQAIRQAVARVGARRVAIDSVSGFELALAPDFRQDFRESLYRLVGALTGTGITVLMTMEIVQTSSELRFSPYIISFLSDDIILLRHVEIAGQLRKSLAVIKMRNSDHSKELWLYDITGQGLIVRQRLHSAHGTGAGTATLSPGAAAPSYPGLTDRERLVLRALLELGEVPVDELAQRTGAGAVELAEALNRLMDLGYVERREVGGTFYRSVAPAL
jgi:circadian clock protein KaiC